MDKYFGILIRNTDMKCRILQKHIDQAYIQVREKMRKYFDLRHSKTLSTTI